MPNANLSKEILSQPQLLLSAATNQLLSKSARVTAGGSRNLRLDLYCGIANGGTATLQHSSGFNMWTTAKTGTFPTQAGTTATVDASTDIVTSTSHGMVQGQAFVMTSSGQMPNPLVADTVYYVQLINANSFKVGTEPTSPGINLLSAGTGTLTVCPVTMVSIQLNVEVAGDQAVMPLKSECRLLGTGGGGGDTHVVSARLLIED